VTTSILMLLSLIAANATLPSLRKHLSPYLTVGLVLILTPFFFDTQSFSPRFHDIEYAAFHLGCATLLLALSVSLGRRPKTPKVRKA
jgi:hypothetical protein